MAGDVEITVDRNLVHTVLNEKINAAIASELSKTPEMMATIVSAIMKTQVNSEGKIDSSSYANKYPLIEALAMKAVRDAATKAVHAWVETQQPKLQAALEAQLRRRTNGLAKAMVEGLMEAMKSNWKFRVDCNFTEERR